MQDASVFAPSLANSARAWTTLHLCTFANSPTTCGMSLDVAPAVLVAVQAVVPGESGHAMDVTEGVSDDKDAENWVSLEFTHAGKAYTLDLADSDRFAFRV